jgi:hypothetical protein
LIGVDIVRELDVLVGTWDTAGTLLPDGTPFTAEDRYEWFPGGHFLVHHVDANMGERVRALEVFRAADGGIVAESYDSAGGHMVSRVTLADGELRIVAEGERFTGRVEEDQVTGFWERREGDGWVRWMTVSLTRRSR